MRFIWEEYSIQKHVDLDKWNDSNSNIDKFAMFGESLSRQVTWYKENPNDPISNYKDYFFVIKNRNGIMGYIICNVSNLGEYYQAGINPIVINPDFNGKGLGKEIVVEFINNSQGFLGVHIKEFLVMVDKKNTTAYRLFQETGFIVTKREDDFIEMIYTLL
jgi:L-amino acid N-acyltransferase YncA